MTLLPHIGAVLRRLLLTQPFLAVLFDAPLRYNSNEPEGAPSFASFPKGGSADPTASLASSLFLLPCSAGLIRQPLSPLSSLATRHYFPISSFALPYGASPNMKLILHVWRQKNAQDKGRLVRYEHPDVNQHMSFLEMLDVLNEKLILKGEDPIAFDHDCREGICGMCGFMINGKAHGGLPRTTVCQLHMRHFKDGDELYLEPWRASAFPIVKDLAVNRSSFDRIIAA